MLEEKFARIGAHPVLLTGARAMRAQMSAMLDVLSTTIRAPNSILDVVRSLKPCDERVSRTRDGRGGRRPPRNWRAFAMLVALITIPLIAIDQLSKIYISTHMSMYESIPIIPNWFDITYTQNPGAAFSMFANFPPIFRTVFLFALSAIAIVVLLAMIAQTEEISVMSIAFAMVLAGASGNLIDRAIRGRVIDFVRVHYYDRELSDFQCRRQRHQHRRRADNPFDLLFEEGNLDRLLLSLTRRLFQN